MWLYIKIENCEHFFYQTIFFSSFHPWKGNNLSLSIFFTYIFPCIFYQINYGSFSYGWFVFMEIVIVINEKKLRLLLLVECVQAGSVMSRFNKICQGYFWMI